MEKSSFIFGVILFVVVVSSSSVQAEILLKNFDKSKEKFSTEVEAYITGVGSGISFANAMLSSRKLTELYCAPPNLALTYTNYMDILDREIKENKNKYSLDTPVEAILLVGLQKVFPCEK